jgi:hypothetical protein
MIVKNNQPVNQPSLFPSMDDKRRGEHWSMEMIIKKCGIALAIITCLLVGISSGDFINEPIQANVPSWFDDYEPFNASSWTEPGWFGSEYEPATFGSGWFDSEYVPFTPDPSTFNLGWFGVDISEYLYPAAETGISKWEPEPIIMPRPLSISKEELFNSKVIISTQKQSLISSLQSGGGNSIFF